MSIAFAISFETLVFESQLMKPKDVFQPVNAAALRLAETLLRTEKSAALATLDPETGAPLASRVNLATAMDGRPVILISRLSDHFPALESDPRASLLIGQPGGGDPLAHPRLMVSGAVEKLHGHDLQQCRYRFLNRHPGANVYVDFADFAFWGLRPEKATLNGGFAKAYRLVGDDLVKSADEDFTAMEAGAVDHMNEDHGDAIKLYAEVLAKQKSSGWVMTSFDPGGLDLMAGDRAARIWFDEPLQRSDQLRPRLVQLAKQARARQAEV